MMQISKYFIAVFFGVWFFLKLLNAFQDPQTHDNLALVRKRP